MIDVVDQKKKGFLYLVLVAIPIIASVFYGQLLESNIGSFKDYGSFGGHLPLWAIILIPSLITIYYVFLILVATKLELLKRDYKNFSFLILLLIMGVYMTILISTKDISHSFAPGFNNVTNTPTFNERLWSIFSFYLNLLTIYSIFFLIKPVYGFKEVMVTLFGLIIAFTIISIIYSLIVEWDKYVNFEGFDDLYDKDGFIYSFFSVGNAFGHTVYLGILSIIALAMCFRKYWLILFSLPFIPFIFYSNCRVALVGTFFVYFGLFLYFWVRSFKYNKYLFLFFTLILVLFALGIFIDFNYYNFIKFELKNGTEISLKQLIFDIWDTFLNERLSIIHMIPIDKNDILFGFGYGLNYIIPRSYGYFYYFHNALYEIVMIGGIPFLFFVIILYLILFKRLFKLLIKKHNYRLIGFVFAVLLAQFFYGLFESHIALINDYHGTILGLFIFAIPFIYSNFLINGYKTIDINKFYGTKKFIIEITEIYDINSLSKYAKYGISIISLYNLLNKLACNLGLNDEWKFEIVISAQKTLKNANSLNIYDAKVTRNYENKICEIII